MAVVAALIARFDPARAAKIRSILLMVNGAVGGSNAGWSLSVLRNGRDWSPVRSRSTATLSE